jgi:D-alanyl-lipoteichoic acid acyltransferase DltB (MBOAT superfamily)
LAGAVNFLPFILFTSAVIWFSARQIGLLYEKQNAELAAGDLDKAAKKEIRETYKKKARKILILALILCIGILCVTKFTKYAVHYLNLIATSLNGSAPFNAAWLLVPLGISYYTFSTVGYVLDVYWKRYTYEKNFLRFFLYAIYFPHIVQGPISRYNLLGQELKKELRFDSRRIAFGMELMLWGFFKKLVIADRLNIFVSAVYDGKSHSGCLYLVAMIFDAFQIYTDFSGYTDIVRGASQMFGVELEQNFNHPFFSKTVPEYWRRWHMTLGGWFKDYVYYPCTISRFMKNLNKKTKKALPERMSRFITVVIPVFVTWVLTGLWHGTGKTYLAWGVYYSTLITISVAFQPEFAKLTKFLRIKTDTFSWQLFRMVRTFCCFMGGRLLTSPGSLHNTLLVIKNIIFYPRWWKLFDGTLFTLGLSVAQFVLILFCILVLWAVSMMQERFSVREALEKQNIVFRWIIIYIAIFAIIIFGVYGLGYDASAFLYMQY